jgi:hypothetical protein
MSPGGLTSVACACEGRLDDVALLAVGLGVEVGGSLEEAVFGGVDDPPQAESRVVTASRTAIGTAVRLPTWMFMGGSRLGWCWT